MALPLGIFISFMCLTGGILVFRVEIQHLIHPDTYYVDEVKETPMSFAELIPKVHEALPDIAMEGVFLSTDPRRTYSFDFETAKNTSVEVDPYTGEIKGKLFPGEPEFDTLFDVAQKLHTTLLFNVKQGEFSLGRFITGLSTLVLTFIVITGIVIWAPKKIKNIKDRLKVNTKKGGFRFWYDLHLAGGILAAIFLLTMVLTGLDYSYEWYHNGLSALFGVEEQAGPPPGAVKGNRGGEKQEIDYVQIGMALDKVVAQLRHDYPDATDMGFKYGGRAFVTTDNGISEIGMSWDNKTGALTEPKTFSDQPMRTKLEMTVMKLHEGKFLAGFSKTLWLLTAIIGTILPITGYYFYFRKITRKSINKKLKLAQA